MRSPRREEKKIPDMSEFPSEIGPTTEAVVRESQRITPADAAEVRRLRIQVADPGFAPLAGQSVGVLVPGAGSPRVPYLRRYSIAGFKTLPLDAGVDIDLLVRRCFHRDERSGERRPGIASNYLCDARPGDRLTISGPCPGPFVLPLDKRSNLLMIGTGTGIAPFRAFAEQLHARHGGWIGEVRLFYGGRSGLDLTYANDEGTDLPLYFDRRTFEAFEVLGQPLGSPGTASTSKRKLHDQSVSARERSIKGVLGLRSREPGWHPAATSAETLKQGLSENAGEAFRLIKQPNTFVFLAGRGSVAAVFDECMAERAGSVESWQGIKARLKAEKRWAELLYD